MTVQQLQEAIAHLPPYANVIVYNETVEEYCDVCSAESLQIGERTPYSKADRVVVVNPTVLIRGGYVGGEV